MMSNNPFALYSGEGQTLSDRNLELPPFSRIERLDDPRLYLADKPLRDAVNVALALGSPLLLTGGPGTGKTQLASSVAYELALPPPLVFNTKTTSAAKDLLIHINICGTPIMAQFRRGKSVLKSISTLRLSVLQFCYR